MPNITGQIYRTNDDYPLFDGAESWGAMTIGKMPSKKGFILNADSLSRATSIDFWASNSNSIYGSSDKVQPNSLVTQYLIKY